MSDIGLDWGPLDWAEIALFAGIPGLILGAMLGAIAWRRHRLWGRAPRRTVGLVCGTLASSLDSGAVELITSLTRR